MPQNKKTQIKRNHAQAFNNQNQTVAKKKFKYSKDYSNPFNNNNSEFIFFYTKTIWCYLMKHYKQEDAMLEFKEIDRLKNEINTSLYLNNSGINKNYN